MTQRKVAGSTVVNRLRRYRQGRLKKRDVVNDRRLLHEARRNYRKANERKGK